jgi:hypothetical protein
MQVVGATGKRIGGLAIAALWLGACGQTDVIAERGVSAAGAGTGTGEMPASEAPEPGSRAAFCGGEAGLYTITADGRSALECASRLAARSFRHAVCACGMISGPGHLSTSGFEASVASAPMSGAAVGIGQASAAVGPLPALELGGSLSVLGSARIALAASAQTVTGDLRSSAPLAFAPGTALRVERDARLPTASTLEPAQLSVGRDLYLSPPGADAAAAQRWSTARVEGEIRTETPAFAPPCPCEPHQRIDVAATVAWARSHNDNAELGVAAGDLSAVAQPITRELACGRYSFDRIDGGGVITLRIDQPVALFVGDLLGWVEVRLGPAGSLDLFVAGRFQPRGGVLGDRDRPAATRVYVHDQPAPGPLPMFGELASNFYAPTVGVQTFGVLRHGSMLVRDLIVSDTLSIRYDRSVADPGACGAAASATCSGQGDCADGLGCVAGSCARCARDEDCGAPMICAAGRCEALLP